MTLFEKVKQETKDERSFEEFIVPECVYDHFEILRGHFDRDVADSYCDGHEPLRRCKKCWRMEYIEGGIVNERSKNH